MIFTVDKCGALLSVGSNASLVINGNVEVPCTWKTFSNTNTLCLEVFSFEELDPPLKETYPGTVE